MFNNKSKTGAYLPLLLSITLSLGIVIGYYYNHYKDSYQRNNESEKIPLILSYINKFYVDTISIADLNEKAIPEILKNLDPHTLYMPAEEALRENEPLEGGFSGIGVQFNMDKDTIIVVAPVPNGPSAKLGILPGDRIVKVDGKVVAGVKMKSDSIVRRLKGPVGTKVNVTIKRPHLINLLEFNITRENIPLHSIDFAYMPKPGIGYIKINQFSRITNDEFENEINKLKEQGMTKIIVDLRSNGGGYLDAAIKLADQFLEKGQLIVYTVGRSRKKDEIARATEDGLCKQDSVVVLIDEYSASASEIFAGALQDNDRGIIVGRRSFGKGLVQKPVILDDGSVLRLTIARYYTPSGRCIQKPYNKGESDYEMDIYKRYEKGELSNKDSIHLNDSLVYKTPKGKVVYGGGGIMPDVFVPLEQDNKNIFYNEIMKSGLIYTFAFEYSDKHRSAMGPVKDIESINKYLQNNNMIDEFISYVRSKGIKIDRSSFNKSQDRIEILLRAYIARNFIDNKGYYPLMLSVDETMQKALKILAK